MKRLILCLLIAAPLGCSSAGGPWMSEFERDPDLQIDIWKKPAPVQSEMPGSSEIATKK